MRAADWCLLWLLRNVFGTAAATHWPYRGEVFIVDVALGVLTLSLLLLGLRVIVRLQDLLLQSAGALVEDGQELFGQPFNLIQICIGVDIGVPSFALQGVCSC